MKIKVTYYTNYCLIEIP